jgi:hypothetical protein
MGETSSLQDSSNGVSTETTAFISHHPSVTPKPPIEASRGPTLSRKPSVNGSMSPSISAGSTADLISRENEHPLLLPSISPSGEEDTRISPSKPSEVPSTAPSLGGSVDVSLGTLVPTAKTIAQTRRRRRRRRSRHQRQRKRIARNERQHIRALMDNEITNDPVKHETLPSKQ